MMTCKTGYFVADRPITCYKVMYMTDHDGATDASEYRFRSEYMSFIYTLGREYSLRNGENMLGLDLDFGRIKVDKGFHSYARLEDACNYSKHWNSTLNLSIAEANLLVVVECEIPKGARCWMGYEGGYMGYCSDRIKVVAWKHAHENDWTRAVPPAGGRRRKCRIFAS